MSLKLILDSLNEIKSQSSRSVKENLLKKHLKETDNFEWVLRFAYHPYMHFNISSIQFKKPSLLESAMSRNTESLKKALESLSNQKGATDDDRSQLAYLASMDKETVEVVNRILKKDLRCGIGIKTVQKHIDIPAHNVMLCIDDKEKFLKAAAGWENVCYSVKKDGVRTWAVVNSDNTVKYFARSGNEIHNFKVFNQNLIEWAMKLDDMYRIGYPVTFDGEVIDKTGDFDKVMQQLHRLEGQNPWNFKFLIFDLVVENVSLIDRIEMLDVAFPDHHKGPEMVDLLLHFNLDNEQHLLEVMEVMKKKGEEGIVMKDLNSPYEFKRSNYWCKVKHMSTIDLPVLSVEQGTGKYNAVMGALVCDFMGKEVRVGSGYSDAQRHYFYDNPPKMIEVKYQAITKDGSLRFPIFVRARNDK